MVSDYNQSLVRHGKILIGFDVLDNWDAELKEMNENKVGLRAIFNILIPFFFYWNMPKYIFICLIDKPMKELHKDFYGKFIQSLITVQ
jgi:hypothetical protein